MPDYTPRQIKINLLKNLLTVVADDDPTSKKAHYVMTQELAKLERREEREAAFDEGIESLEKCIKEREKYKSALTKLEERFKEKQSLHKDDCFAYQVVSKALGDIPSREDPAK